VAGCLGRDALPTSEPHKTRKPVAAHAAVVADAFLFQQAPMDLSADLPRVRQVAQALIHPKVIRVPERPLGLASATFLEYCFRSKFL